MVGVKFLTDHFMCQLGGSLPVSVKTTYQAQSPFDVKICTSAMHTYSVALRITGTDLDLPDISAKLRLKPTQTRVIGQARSPNSVWDESLWEYEVRPGEDKPVWDSLESGLQTLILAFVSRKEELRDYQQRYKVFLWCGHFSRSFCGGPTLSPQILKDLADFGIELILDTYSSYDPDAE
jgi:hypothetical protein